MPGYSGTPLAQKLGFKPGDCVFLDGAPKHFRGLLDSLPARVRFVKVPTDLTDDVIRAHALAVGLVDVKVCAVDEVWSGLKLVIRLKDREKKS